MRILSLVLLAALMSSCVVIRQDEVAIKRRFGKLVGKPVSEGARFFNPFFATYLRVPVRNINLEISLDIPSQEGLTIRSEVSILYRLDPNKVPQILREVGKNFEENLISPVFRSALADVSARFLAKDMHTIKRAAIEEEVKVQMMNIVKDKGFIIESVLMKRIVLPPSLSRAIEEKLSAEQDAQRMEFVLQREKQEAERKRIEAAGISESQKLLSEGLTKDVLKFRAIEAYRELSQSPNSKVIITSGGQVPFLLDQK
ncbi:MAG: prohibitin family protein [Bacteroidota bacterium]